MLQECEAVAILKSIKPGERDKQRCACAHLSDALSWSREQQEQLEMLFIREAALGG